MFLSISLSFHYFLLCGSFPWLGSFSLSLSVSVSVCDYLAQRDPAAHSSCTDHKPQQHNKLRLQRWRDPSCKFLAWASHLNSPRRQFTVHYGGGTKWQQSRDTYFNNRRRSDDLLAEAASCFVTGVELMRFREVGVWSSYPQGRKASVHLIAFQYENIKESMYVQQLLYDKNKN